MDWYFKANIDWLETLVQLHLVENKSWHASFAG